MEMVLRLHEEAKGWPGLLGSLDVMQWEWKNCPKAHRGASQGKYGVDTVQLWKLLLIVDFGSGMHGC